MAKLYFYYAAMNAGKSTTLLQADFNYRERGMETMLWTAAHDDRSGTGSIGSRIALSAPAHTYSSEIDLFVAVAEELKKRELHCVPVDEAQFLTRDHVLQLCRVTDELKIPVLCYGLRTDFRADLFEGSAALLALADALIELKAVCECGRKATMNLRVDEGGTPLLPATRPRSAATTATSRCAAGISSSGCARARRVSSVSIFRARDAPRLDHPRQAGRLGSTTAVSAVKRILREADEPKTKVGHGGTLDPLASGVLPIALGEATKLCGRMLDANKELRVHHPLRRGDDTLDAEGKVVARNDVRPTLEQIEAVLPQFTGAIEQLPPAYSALKIGGKAAYARARAGEDIEMKPRTVTVHELKLLPGTGRCSRRLTEGSGPPPASLVPLPVPGRI